MNKAQKASYNRSQVDMLECQAKVHMARGEWAVAISRLKNAISAANKMVYSPYATERIGKLKDMIAQCKDMREILRKADTR